MPGREGYPHLGTDGCHLRPGTFSLTMRLYFDTIGGVAMLKWALIFLVISLITGFLGFSGVSAATATIAKVLFAIALVIFLIFLVLALMAGNLAF